MLCMATQKILEAAILKEILFEASGKENAQQQSVQLQIVGDPLYIVFDQIL